MSKFKFLFGLIFLLMPAMLIGQAVHQHAPVIGLANPEQGTFSQPFCFTSDLMISEEGLRAIEEFRMWDAVQRPDYQLFDTYTIGDERNFKVRNIEASFSGNHRWDNIRFTLRAKGDHAYVWVENGQFASDKVRQQDVNDILHALENATPSQSHNPDNGILEINVDIFGNPPNVNGSGMLHVLVLDIRDGWDPDNGGGYVAGFFDPVDLMTSNSNSNGKDIIYIDAYPHIYRENRETSVVRALSTLAHEHQHLIHARYGRLVTFLNEGQSEWAELLNGYIGRAINYVFDPDEMNRFLLEWRSGTQDVLKDYQRASLLHTYLADRRGATDAGRITRATESGLFSYNMAFQQSAGSFEELLAEFHVANLVNNLAINDGRYGHENIRRRSVRALGSAFTYPTGFTEASDMRELYFGGVEYIEFVGVTNFSISVSHSGDTRHFLAGFPLEGLPEVYPMTGSTLSIDGDFERIYLISVFTNSSQPPSANSIAEYTYQANWTPLPFALETLSYYGEIEFFTNLPGDTNDPNFVGRKKLAYRISTAYNGRVQFVRFLINGRESGITGNSELFIMFAPAVQSASAFRPGAPLDTLRVPFSMLSLGDNYFSTPDTWQVQSGRQYYIKFAVADPSGSSMLELLLDGGSSNTADPNYYPPRTQLYVVPPTVPTAGWYSFGGETRKHNNLAVTVGVSGLFTGNPIPPQVQIISSNSNLEFGEPLTIEIQSSGTPAPQFQWFKDGKPIDRANDSKLVIPSLIMEDAGTYHVIAVNFAGQASSSPFEVNVLPGNFRLAQNYPNPFNPVTNIQYAVPEMARVRLRVFSIDGRLVATLVDEVQDSSVYTVPFNASGLASGVYVYELIVGNNQASRKMLLLR